MVRLLVANDVWKEITLRDEIEACIYRVLLEYYELDVVLLHGDLHLLLGEERENSRLFNF